MKRFRAWLLLAALACPPACLADDVSRIVVPYGPGPGLDAVARIVAKQLAVVQGNGVVVENRPGANTVVGTEYVHDAKPDGRTLLINGSALSIGAARGLFSFDPQTGFTPVIQVSDADSLLVVHAGLAATSLEQLAVLARSKGLNCGSVSGQYEIACNQLHTLLGGDGVTIVYKGLGEVTKAVMAGEVDLMFASRSMLNPMLPSGKVRVIAAATDGAADPPYQDLPRLKDRWPGFVLSGLVGLYVTRDTPPQVVEALNRELNQVLNHPEVKDAFKALGVTPVGGSARQLALRLAQDVQFFKSGNAAPKPAKP
jgi:tripartite-type tricarboxylate transporter receptor subunit TctC